MTARYDIFIIGGGINGCGIARDMAGRGFSVCLSEMNDLASGTSSWSTKLIHGGLRYLEHYEFRLVREALKEREVLWRSAPHIIWPLRFVLPHHGGLRPAWMLRLGLYIYDHLGGRRDLPPTSTLDLARHPAGEPLKPEYRRGFEYSDCWVDDARLVVLNARDAAARGATVVTRCRVTGARRRGDDWEVRVRDAATGETFEVRARLLVNAAGPWVDAVLHSVLGQSDARNVRLVQGSHIVVRKLFEHDRAYICQNTDGRITFAIPYEDDFTLIGTTDKDYRADPGEAAISEEEISYLCAAAGQYFAQPPTPDDVVWSYSGVRPLFDDGASKAQDATRDYILKVDHPSGEAPLVNIFGGKITTYRRLAESVARRIELLVGRRGPAWTAEATLPGGDFPVNGQEEVRRRLTAEHPWLSHGRATRLVRQYGTDAERMLSGARTAAELGRSFGAGLTEREVLWLVEHEWARTAADIAWRRTKLGLHLDDAELREIEGFIRAKAPPVPVG